MTFHLTIEPSSPWWGPFIIVPPLLMILWLYQSWRGM
jgi:hypothetical protein